jgi:hypothetical protein
MPYTFLKISKIVDDRVEVAGEFAGEEEARKFVEAELFDARMIGLGEDHEYLIEPPPTIRPARD